ncbi:hypothetical protein [Streptomyces sp. WZ.A104]
MLRTQRGPLDGGAVLRGAYRPLDAGDDRRGWRVYADPAGHPYCLVRR